MNLTDRWLKDPTHLINGNSGIRMWDTHAAVDDEGVLTFCQSPASVSPHPAKLILSNNDAGFGITLVSKSHFNGLQTHYEYPGEFIEFTTITVNDLNPDRASLYAANLDGPVAELLIKPAQIVAWTLCKMINQKIPS